MSNKKEDNLIQAQQTIVNKNKESYNNKPNAILNSITESSSFNNTHSVNQSVSTRDIELNTVNLSNQESLFSRHQPMRNTPLSLIDNIKTNSNIDHYLLSKSIKNKNESNQSFLIEDEIDIKKPDPVQLTINNQSIPINEYQLIAISKKRSEIKQKYSCNCKRSKCLKLYCDCFANGELCIDCNCQGCSNVVGNDVEIRKAFIEVKDKNPVAIKLNISDEVTTLGCNCTKSNCSKKYCECFKAKLACTETCRCRDCDNCAKGNKHSKTNVTGCNSNLAQLPFHLRNVYSKYTFQKISIEISNAKINIERNDVISPYLFLINAELNQEQGNENKNEEKQEKAIVKIKNNQTMIEIPKSNVSIDNEIPNSNNNQEDHNLFLNKKRKGENKRNIIE